MNKQELIEEFKKIGIYRLNIFGTEIKAIPTECAIDLIKQLDEPEKVKVPQFVAEWYEKHKKDFDFELWDVIFRNGQGEKTEISRWINNTKDALIILANMHQFGYEVEEEKRYYIRLKGVDENYNYLNFIKHLNGWVLDSIRIDKKFRAEHTRKQLEEAGFGWVFDCPGIEIEEVEG